MKWKKNQTFYEQKCFRLLGNVYIKLLDEGSFDLSSLLAGELAHIGLIAIEKEDDNLVNVIIVRFNTLIRFATKHGTKNNEPRNLYNLAFHYGNFINYLVDHKKIQQVKQCLFYLRIYGIEIFKHGRNCPPLFFIVDVIAAEMKKILEKVFQYEWDHELQNGFLSEILMVDNPPDINKEDLDKGILVNNGVRILQMGLALFYLREGMNDFVQRIVKDVLDDLEALGEASFYQVIEASSNRLKFSGPSFWEDTDRGSLNIYYTSNQDYVDPFKQQLYDGAKVALLKNVQKKYQLEQDEADLLWEMSRLLEPANRELTNVINQVKFFELALQKLENIDQSKLTVLIKVREKLQFTTDNPKLIATNTRQIATSVKLVVFFRDEQNQTQESSFFVKFNSPNYIYIESVGKKPMFLSEIKKMPALTFRFTTLRHRRVYQFHTRFAEGKVTERNLYRLIHTEKIKIIAED